MANNSASPSSRKANCNPTAGIHDQLWIRVSPPNTAAIEGANSRNVKIVMPAATAADASRAKEEDQAASTAPTKGSNATTGKFIANIVIV